VYLYGEKHTYHFQLLPEWYLNVLNQAGPIYEDKECYLKVIEN